MPHMLKLKYMLHLRAPQRYEEKKIFSIGNVYRNDFFNNDDIKSNKC